jgi:hypothetical protein
MMLLKWLHSSLSSFSAVHSNSRTCRHSTRLYRLRAKASQWPLTSTYCQRYQFCVRAPELVY